MRPTRLYGLLLVLVTVPATAEIYRWMDPQGRIHYGDRPPPGIGEKMTVREAPAPDSDLEMRRHKQQRLLDAFQDERHQQQAAAEKRQQDAERRRQSCRRARDQLRNIQEARRVYDVDEDGNRTYRWWANKEKEHAMAETRQAIERYCD